MSYSAAGLPPGLSIGPATGVISGSPSSAGSYSVTITQAGTFSYNCHIHAGMKGSFKVAVPPTP